MLLTTLELKWVPLADSRQLMVMVLVLAFVVPLEVLAGHQVMRAEQEPGARRQR
jgi:hypothetical protein